MAADVVTNSETGDDYVIVTKTGQKISPTEIFVRSSATIDSDGKTVNRDKTWKELLNFHSQLSLPEYLNNETDLVCRNMRFVRGDLRLLCQPYVGQNADVVLIVRDCVFTVFAGFLTAILHHR